MKLFRKKDSSPKQDPNPSFFQPKLKIGEPNDAFEQEADAMADNVVKDSRQQSNKGVQKMEEEEAQAKRIQRQEEEEAQAKPIQREEEEEAAQAKHIQRQEEEEAQAKPIQREEEEEAAQPKRIQREEEEEESMQMKRIQRQEEEEAQAKPIQRMEEEEPQAKRIQRQEEEEATQAKPIQRMEEEEAQAKPIQKQEEEEATQAKMIQRKEMNRSAPLVQLKEDAAGSGDNMASESVTNRLRLAKGKGMALPEDVVAEMNQQFGVDFSGVRIHTDAEAIALTAELDAQAFTHGADIYFNAGKYNPQSDEGRRLLIHELTHVVQQGAAGKRK